MQTGVFRPNLYFKLLVYLFIYFSYSVPLFTFPLRLEALTKRPIKNPDFNDEEPPLLSLGAATAAPAKRHIYQLHTNPVGPWPATPPARIFGGGFGGVGGGGTGGWRGGVIAD